MKLRHPNVGLLDTNILVYLRDIQGFLTFLNPWTFLCKILFGERLYKNHVRFFVEPKVMTCFFCRHY